MKFEQGRWYVSFVTHVRRWAGRPAHVAAGARVVGLDLGVKDLIVVATPNGAEISRVRAPAHLRQARSRLRALRRKAARQVGPYDPASKTRRDASAGWKHTQAQLRTEHARVANLRTDLIHQTVTTLAQTHQVIGVETLAAKNMAAKGGRRKCGLNRAIRNASFGEVIRQLDYKTGWYGSNLMKADRWYPSSKTCSGCGTVKTRLTLAERTYQCHTCGLIIDRDRNAAINLARQAKASTINGREWLARRRRSRPEDQA